jgi:beta-N-acetylhexosaminidase
MFLSSLSPSVSSAQDTNLADDAQILFEAMSSDERVGQLFLVTFTGDSVDADSEIVDLVLNYNVGGVILLAENDNITNFSDTAVQVAELTSSLQRLALAGPTVFEEDGLATSTPSDDLAVPTSVPFTEFTAERISVPLLVGTIHEGDGSPFTEIRNGLTQLPNQMAIGATWQPEASAAIGEIAGRELAAMGVNMLLGPSLDVLENPSPLDPSDLGTRTFGGDPYWVGLMGQAYTEGVHKGSNGRIAVIAKHFPGYGSSDRPLNEEVGTVRKSLEQLKQLELAPFFAVTGNADNNQAQVDGLLTAHVRYQGFQGNIRDTTAPVSFDPQALSTLMQLPEFAEWREDGGVIVSDALGVNAVQRFYDDTGTDFPHRQVAKDALLAGNDLLFLSQFAQKGSGYSAELANTKDTINWFREKYATDLTFQQRIDEAALNIIRLKLSLYEGDFAAESVVKDTTQLSNDIGRSESTTFDLVQNAVTLISPNPAEFIEQLPPGISDQIVIFTDVRNDRQCTTCRLQPWLSETAVEERMLALYGPQASAQVRPDQFESFSFAELKEFLLAEPDLPTQEVSLTPDSTDSNTSSFLQLTPVPSPTLPPGFLVGEALEGANWVIFATLRPEETAEYSDALSLFLAQRPDIVRNAKIVVFAYNAPYYLDTTEISKVDAFFGVYSKIDQAVDASVRSLFQESPLDGKSPVNIDGIGYNLFEVTQADSNQIIELFIIDDGTLKSPPIQEPLEVRPGATLRLQTGAILDNNGNPVPDGTPVQFIQQDRLQGFVNVIDERPTINGIANLDYLLEARTGNFRISAVAGGARASQEVDIVIGENAIVSVSTPTPAPTETPTSTDTATATTIPTAEPSVTPSLTPRPTATPVPLPDPQEPTLETVYSEIQMLFALGLGLFVTGGAGFVIGRNDHRDLSETIQCIMWGLVGGLLAYIYFVLGLPGAQWLVKFGNWAGLITALLGGTVGLVLFYLRARVSS